MKKIENFLWANSFLVKIVLILLWILWAVQLFCPLKKTIVESFKTQWSRDGMAERIEALQLQRVAIEKLEVAKKEGIYYSPQRYFSDLKDIESKKSSSQIPSPLFYIGNLGRLSWENVANGHYTQQDAEIAASEYRCWLEGKIGKREEFKEEFKTLRWQRIISWLITLYKRTTFLILLFYIIRMVDRRGILETILAEKKKFVLAVVLWPIYFFKYPHNVVREIRVEAELRRFKGLFRKLSFRELGLVREVANSSYYKEWIAEYHQQNRNSFMRGLFIVLIATLVIHLFLPSAKTSEKRARSPGSMIIAAESCVDAFQNLTEDVSEDNQVEQRAIPPGIEFYDPLLLIVIVKFLKSTWCSREPDKIDRVPRSSFFGVVNISINQRKKGKNYEHGQDYNLCSFLDRSGRNCVCY